VVASGDPDRLGSCLGLELGSPNLAEAILDAAPVIIVVLDADGRIVHYNPFMERLCGRAIAQTRGRDWFAEFVPADERERIRAMFDAALDEAPTEANVSRILVGDGETRLIEWYDRKLLRADGEVTGIVAVGVDISERVRVARAQAEMAEILRLFDTTLDEIALVVDETRTQALFASASLERVLGIPREAVYADIRAMFERVHPDDRERMLATIGQPVPETGISYECRVLRCDGEVRWLVSHLRPLPADSSLPGGIISVSMDITERHEAEEALRRLTEQLEARVSERTRSLEGERERLQQILDAMAVYVGLLDDRGQIIQLNAKTRSAAAELGPLIGAAIDAMPGMHYTAESLLELRAALVEAQAGRLARFDLATSTAPGCLRITDTTFSPLFALDGRVTEIVSTGVDVTDRRATERRLRESLAELELKEARLADAQRIAEVGDWDWDVDADTLLWSDQVYRIFALDPESVEVSYALFLARVHPDDRAAVEAAVARAGAEQTRYEIEHRIVRPDGDVRLVRESGEVSRDHTGRAVRFQGTIQDITRQKQVEAQLRASLAEKDALLHEIHHRVKNNLQVVASLLYLRSVDAEPSVCEILDECRARIRSMVLIHEHLYLSGQLAGIDMHTFLAKLGDELTRIYAGERRIAVRVEGGGLVLPIERAVPIALIANELLTNALKYAYPDPQQWTDPEVRVRVSPEALEIADDGVGLPANFEAATTTTLGLRLVQSLVRQLDAQLEFERGAGTRIRLSFPMSALDEL
jgi:PAS domain S-box-containing protein